MFFPPLLARNDVANIICLYRSHNYLKTDRDKGQQKASKATVLTMKITVSSHILLLLLSTWKFCTAFQYDYSCYDPYCPHIGSSYCICKGDKNKVDSPCPDYSLGGWTFYLTTVVGLSSDTCNDVCVMIDTSPYAYQDDVPNTAGLPTSISCADDKIYFQNDLNNTLYESIDLTVHGTIPDCPTIDDFPGTPTSVFLGLVNESGGSTISTRSNVVLSAGFLVHFLFVGVGLS